MEELGKLLMKLNSYRRFYKGRMELVGDKNSLPKALWALQLFFADYAMMLIVTTVVISKLN